MPFISGIDVHQDDVRTVRRRFRNRLATVGGLPDDVDVLLGLQDHPEPGPDQALVVGQQDLDHRADPSGSRARTA
jgi:hypothetical protein